MTTPRNCAHEVRLPPGRADWHVGQEERCAKCGLTVILYAQPGTPSRAVWDRVTAELAERTT